MSSFFRSRALPPLCASMLFAHAFARAAGSDNNTNNDNAPSDATGVAVQNLPALDVIGDRAPADDFRVPQVLETVDADRVAATVNIVDTEDAVKYFPSLFLRKRNYGDTQAVLATRVWGVSSSARSLVYADGILLSALIANNNAIGGPRWGLVAPTEIARVDVLYGPFSAAYPGNSMGAVMEITTRTPETLEASLTQTEAWQHFSLYGTKDDFFTHQTAATVGNRSGKFSYWISANHQDSESQPLTFVTAATFPEGTSGGFAARNKLGAPANVLGAGGLLHTRMTHAKAKLAYDFTPWLRAAYTLGLWRNDAGARAETYLRNNAGDPTYAGLAGFASGTYALEQQHSAQSLALKTDTKGAWDFDVTASAYRFDRDTQRFPTSASGTTTEKLSFGAAGRVAVLTGTHWSTLDAKGIWRVRASEGGAFSHVVSFGAHLDRYRLANPTFETADWRAADAPSGKIVTLGEGSTRTRAWWAQDLWRVSDNVRVSLGARFEQWRAYAGRNVNGAVIVRQPEVRDADWSPKATLAWDVAPRWQITASFGRAHRFATAAELYQLVSTGATFTAPNPDLKPDDVFATELRLERTLEHGRARLSLFQDDVRDAIIAQFKPLVEGSPQLFNYVSNVDRVRARGVEIVLEQNDVLARGLGFSGSVTWLDARTLATSGRASATAAPDAAIGRRLPNIPEWRATFLATWRAGDRCTLSLGARYSSLLYTTLDNADVNPNSYQGFSEWFVADAHAAWRIDRRWSATLGVDNLLNRKYFLFHPFPQRTFVTSVEASF